MSMRGGRGIDELDVISQTLPRSYGSQHRPCYPGCHPTFASPLSLRTRHKAPTERQVPHELMFSPQVVSYHPPPPPESEVTRETLCDVCETIDDYLLQQRQHPPYQGFIHGTLSDTQPKVDWCSECDKHDVGPPCKCLTPDCGGRDAPIASGLSYEHWHQMTPVQHNQKVYPRHSQYGNSYVPMHQLPRASSDCMLNNLNNVDDRVGMTVSHCHDPFFHDTVSRVPSALQNSSPRAFKPARNHSFVPISVSPRLSRSLEHLPKDIKEHILKCQCSCDHMGYGNFSATSLHNLTEVGTNNGFSTPSSKHSSHTDLQRESPSAHKQRELDIRGHVWGVVCLVLVLAGVAGVGVSVPLALKHGPDDQLQQRIRAAESLLSETPLVDGHNDLPWNIRKFMHNKLHSFNLTADLSSLRPWSRSAWSHTDLPRLRRGHVGAQFWVSYVPCESQFLNAVQLTIEQIDLIKRLIEQYPDDLQIATSAEDVEMAFGEGRIASLIGVEGGHAIQNSLGVLRALHDLGVRYMTLTHTCSTPWAESARNKESDSEDPNSPRGLTHFGKTVVREMNRLGLLVDLSHVSQATMRAALQVSRSPVLFSHSSVYALCKNPRNVPDDILRKVAVNGGLVMVSFYNHFLTCNREATVKDVVKHINYVRAVAGVDHVGIGADFDGIDKLPFGLEDVSKYPNLFAELMSDPTWKKEDLKKLAGLNLLRVLRDVEKVRKELRLRKAPPLEEEVPPSQLLGRQNCSYNFVEAKNPS